jgi:hypothetical protein
MEGMACGASRLPNVLYALFGESAKYLFGENAK